MLKRARTAAIILVVLSGFFVSAVSPADAQQAGNEVVQENPWEVSGIKVDQTAENAVVARTKAMAEAKRQAFQKLVERNLPADEVSGFKMPDDKTISSVVQDFEIEDEQISANRYVANFTVRFKRRVLELIQVNLGMKGVMAPQPTTASLAPGAAAPVIPVTTPASKSAAAGKADTTTSALVPAPVKEPSKSQIATETDVAPASTLTPAPAPSSEAVPAENTARPSLVKSATMATRGVLVLPYLQNIAGKLHLWDDPNPWMQAWQTSPLTTPRGRNIILPAGDISDVSSGSSDAIWSGDISVVEKLRQKYNVQEVVLTVINKSGPGVTIDVYQFRDGVLGPKQSISPYISNMEGDAPYRMGVQEVLKYMQSSPDEQVSREDILASISKDVIKTTPDVIPLASPVDAGVPDANERAQLTLAPREAPRVIKPVKAEAAPVAGEAVALSAPSAPALPTASADPNLLNVEASLTGISTWLNIQKRLAEISPPLDIKVKSLTSSKASFALRFSGTTDDLRMALGVKGLALSNALPGPASTAIYDLRLTE